MSAHKHITTGMIWNLALPISFLGLTVLSNLPFYYLKNQPQRLENFKRQNPRITTALFFLKACFNTFCDPLVLINFYRDFDWAGVNNLMTVFGFRRRVDAYHPAAIGWADNLLICARTLSVGLVLMASFALMSCCQQKTKARIKEQALTIACGSLAAAFGLLAWNIPGWAAQTTYDLAAPTFMNYGFFYMAVGLLEGFAQTLFNQLPSGVSSLFTEKFLTKLTDSWYAGAWWNTAFVAQGIGYFGPPNHANLGKYNLAAFSLALGVASFNVLVSIRHQVIDAGVNLSSYLHSNFLPAPGIVVSQSDNLKKPLLSESGQAPAAPVKPVLSPVRIGFAMAGYGLALIAAATFAIGLGGLDSSKAVFHRACFLGALMPVGIVIAKVALSCCRSTAAVDASVAHPRGSRHFAGDGASVDSAA